MEIYQIDNVAMWTTSLCGHESAKTSRAAAHYRKAFAAVLAPQHDAGGAYRKAMRIRGFLLDKCASLSESEVSVVKRSSKRNAYYVDGVGFQKC